MKKNLLIISLVNIFFVFAIFLYSYEKNIIDKRNVETITEIEKLNEQKIERSEKLIEIGFASDLRSCNKKILNLNGDLLIDYNVVLKEKNISELPYEISILSKKDLKEMKNKEMFSIVGVLYLSCEKERLFLSINKDSIGNKYVEKSLEKIALKAFDASPSEIRNLKNNSFVKEMAEHQLDLSTFNIQLDFFKDKLLKEKELHEINYFAYIFALIFFACLLALLFIAVIDGLRKEDIFGFMFVTTIVSMFLAMCII